MFINLSDGRKFRASWRHINNSLPKRKQLIAEKKVNEVLETEAVFQDRLHFFYGDGKHFADMYDRIHGISECFLVPIVTGKERIESPNGTFFCSKKDVFSSEVGRKNSLMLALDEFFPLDGSSPEEWKENKKFRTEVWEQYRKSTKTPRW